MTSLPPMSANSVSSAWAAPANRRPAKARAIFFIGCSGLEADLHGQIGALLVVLDDDVAEIDIGRGQRHVLGEEIRGEQIPRIVFARDAEIVGFGAELGAHGEVAAEKIGGRALELRRVAVVLVAAEAEDSELV